MGDIEDEPMDIDSSFSYEKEDLFEEKIDRTDAGLALVSQDDKTDNLLLESRYENKGGTFTTGIDIFSKEEQQKMKERAKRFGLKDTTIKSGTDDLDQDLYSSMGIDEDSENIKINRLNALHMRGTEDMSTKDVFKYFEDYAPASIEWINDISCNVVWMDNISAARALLHRSRKINGLSEKTDSESNDKNEEKQDNLISNDHIMTNDKNEDEGISLKDIKCPLPPGVWRKGIDCPKSKGIFLRFATRNDKKQPNAEKMSDYYKKYGNPNFGGMRGLLSESKKRSYKEVRQKKKNINEGEENGSEKKGKNPWGELSEQWGENDNLEEHYVDAVNVKTKVEEYGEVTRPRVKDRLGLKSQEPSRFEQIQMKQDSNEENSSESGDDMSKRSKIPRMRMHADDEEEKVKKKKLKTITQVESRDLRSRLGKRKSLIYRDEIQIVVTNRPQTYNAKSEVEEEESASEMSEREEGEWVEEKIEEPQRIHEENEEAEEGEYEEEKESVEKEEEKELSSDSSDAEEKEVQGPKGSVIKVVTRAKPRVASTVWARLNFNTNNDNSKTNDRRNTRETFKGDLRSRLGNQRRRERSPLRIEVKNDIFGGISDQDLSE